MDIKLFQKTQRDLAATVNLVIDTYWEDEISETEMVETIQKLYRSNTGKFIRGDQFTTVIQQQCGKRRLEVVSMVLNENLKLKRV